MTLFSFNLIPIRIIHFLVIFLVESFVSFQNFASLFQLQEFLEDPLMLWNKFRIWSFINKLLNRFFSFLYFTNVKFRLFEARSCWVFPEESFLECIIFLVRSVRIWITFFLLKWKYFAFNPIWSEYFKTTKDSCNPEIGKHNDPGQGRLVCMHPHIPNKVPKRTDNQRSLEHNENLLDEFSPKINRT